MQNDNYEVEHEWMTYKEAAAFTRWSVRYLRNLVNRGEIPVYGLPRVRRFRRSMLIKFMTDREAAMREFLHEGDS